jgi:hypothetical protein
MNESLSLRFNFALEYAIINVQRNQARLKLNGTHQLWVYTDVNNQNCIHVVIKRILNPRMVATIQSRILPFVLNRRETYFHALGETHNLSVFENRFLGENSGCDIEERMDGWRNLHDTVILIFTIHYRDKKSKRDKFCGACNSNKRGKKCLKCFCWEI